MNSHSDQHPNKNTVVFLSHGGGPMPLLGDSGHSELVANLNMIATVIEKPSAILVISAHWEEKVPTVTLAEQPALIYDYYGFPPESYAIQYPAPGAPALAKKVSAQLQHKGINANLDAQRGFDHGLFVPLKIMFPAADIPCVQLSLNSNLNAKAHIQMGMALADLEHDGLLVLGSGFSFHNLHAFFGAATPDAQQMNHAFEHWLLDTCANRNITEAERTERLENWEQAPFARYCHPREEHLLPLHVCYGFAQRACAQVFEFEVLGKKASAYRW